MNTQTDFLVFEVQNIRFDIIFFFSKDQRRPRLPNLSKSSPVSVGTRYPRSVKEFLSGRYLVRWKRESDGGGFTNPGQPKGRTKFFPLPPFFRPLHMKNCFDDFFTCYRRRAKIPQVPGTGEKGHVRRATVISVGWRSVDDFFFQGRGRLIRFPYVRIPHDFTGLHSSTVFCEIFEGSPAYGNGYLCPRKLRAHRRYLHVVPKLYVLTASARHRHHDPIVY